MPFDFGTGSEIRVYLVGDHGSLHLIDDSLLLPQCDCEIVVEARNAAYEGCKQRFLLKAQMWPRKGALVLTVWFRHRPTTIRVGGNARVKIGPLGWLKRREVRVDLVVGCIERWSVTAEEPGFSFKGPFYIEVKQGCLTEVNLEMEPIDLVLRLEAVVRPEVALGKLIFSNGEPFYKSVSLLAALDGDCAVLDKFLKKRPVLSAKLCNGTFESEEGPLQCSFGPASWSPNAPPSPLEKRGFFVAASCIESGTLDVKLTPTLLRVRVVDADSGEPLNGFKVVISGALSRTCTDDKLQGVLVPQAFASPRAWPLICQVEVDLDHYVLSSTPRRKPRLAVIPGQTAVLELALRKQDFALHLTVRGPDVDVFLGPLSLGSTRGLVHLLPLLGAEQTAALLQKPQATWGLKVDQTPVRDGLKLTLSTVTVNGRVIKCRPNIPILIDVQTILDATTTVTPFSRAKTVSK